MKFIRIALCLMPLALAACGTDTTTVVREQPIVVQPQPIVVQH